MKTLITIHQYRPLTLFLIHKNNISYDSTTNYKTNQ